MSHSPENHEDFSKKAVIEINCIFCDTSLTVRGMKANLLADSAVELFSTDCPQIGNVSLVGTIYTASICNCNLSDIACIGCGNIVGYHVTKPCHNCLSSCNNGHFWMFLSDSSYEREQGDQSESDLFTWEDLKEGCFERQSKSQRTADEFEEEYLR